MKKIIVFLALILSINTVYAEDITSTSQILINNGKQSRITDKNENSYVTISKGTKINIKSENEINGLYIIYELKSVSGTISNDSKEAEVGSNAFLHEYIDVKKDIGASNEVNIEYKEDVKIGEIYVFDSEDLPDWVEIWKTPAKEADLVLFSTHSDDEQLFFAGLMPYYVAKGAVVQVVYFTNHNNNPKRLHEQLHGLYAVGIRNYPIIGFIPDAYSESLNGALKNLEYAGYSEDDAIKFMVQMIRRFKPLVVVGHDEAGEYSHGQHILNTHVLKKALELTNSSDYDSDSVESYGLWEVPKTYLHLYKENKITMNYDDPLEYFDGMTAYEVSKIGYSKHLSQQYTWFTKWLTGVNSKGVGTPYKSATEIKTYSPLQYGLYKTTVGEDVEKNDMFENLILRKDEKKEEEKKKDKTSKKEKKNNKKKSKSIWEYGLYGLGIIIYGTILYFIFKKKK